MTGPTVKNPGPKGPALDCPAGGYALKAEVWRSAGVLECLSNARPKLRPSFCWDGSLTLRRCLSYYQFDPESIQTPLGSRNKWTDTYHFKTYDYLCNLLKLCWPTSWMWGFEMASIHFFSGYPSKNADWIKFNTPLLHYSNTPLGRLFRQSQLPLTPNGGIFDWPRGPGFRFRIKLLPMAINISR